MVTFAARPLSEAIDNLAEIVAIKPFTAAQRIKLHRPMQSSDWLEPEVSAIREALNFYSRSRPFL